MREETFYKLIRRIGVSATPNDVVELQRKLGVEFPEQYVRFLLACNGGIFDESLECKLLRPGPYVTSAAPDCLFGIHPDCEAFDLLRAFNDLKDRIPQNFIPIGHSGGLSYICITVTNPGRGQIVTWDGYGENAQEECTDRNLYLVAHDFADYVARMTLRADYD